MNKIALAKELRRVAQILTAWDEEGTLNFFIPYTGNPEKTKGKLDDYVNSFSGDYEFDLYMGSISVTALRGQPGLIAMPVTFENRNQARKMMREVKADANAKKLGITVEWD